jgi:small-conductance mechanosensitive channel
MIELNTILLLLSAAVLGIFLGAQIAEACLFVPIWKKMKGDEFFEHYKAVGPLLNRFFTPLTLAATFIPLITVLINVIVNPNQSAIFWLMGVSILIFFATYFLYFKNANQQFSEHALSNEALSVELLKWNNWHWARIGFEAIAFSCSIIILLMK